MILTNCLVSPIQCQLNAIVVNEVMMFMAEIPNELIYAVKVAYLFSAAYSLTIFEVAWCNKLVMFCLYNSMMTVVSRGCN